MESLIKGFGKQLKEAIEIGKNTQLLPSKRDVQDVSIIGLGGSAFGGEIIKNYAFHSCKEPINIYRGYDIPRSINEHSLVILSSYSGNTEETLNCAEKVLKSGAQVVCISSGGKLIDWAIANKFSYFKLPPGYPPRTAAGFSIVQQLYALKHFSLIGEFMNDLTEGIAIIDAFNDHNLAREIAQKCKDKALIIYCADTIESVAIRLRQQVNENAKQLCWHHVIPEMNHNELVGWVYPEFLIEKSAVLFLRSNFEHPRTTIRVGINQQIIKQKSSHIMEVEAKGKSLLGQLFYLLHFGDWLSYFLAEFNKVDPSPVAVIDFLKKELEGK